MHLLILDRCELFCERVGGGGFIKAKVIDGTKCRKDSFDICVNGICRVSHCVLPKRLLYFNDNKNLNCPELKTIFE